MPSTLRRRCAGDSVNNTRAGSRRYGTAGTLAERTCRSPNDRSAGYLETLGVAYAAAGRFSEAIATAQKAGELARSTGQPKLADEIESRLQLYRSSRPYREPLAN
jgi:hypothetical protein